MTSNMKMFCENVVVRLLNQVRTCVVNCMEKREC